MIVASDLGQQLAQGFASGNPADIFYLGNDQVATYAKAGDLAPLDNLKNVKSFYPSLKAAYTYKGHLYAAPKDFSTLALVINTASWKGAKLTNADLPKTWKQLAAVSKKLTRNGQVGLCTGPEFHRLGVFMIQAGGWLVSKDGKTATVNSAANVKAFTFVKSMIKAGSMKLTNQIGAGWGGEGFGKKAMRDDDRGELDLRRDDARLSDRRLDASPSFPPARPASRGRSSTTAAGVWQQTRRTRPRRWRSSRT